MLSLAMRDLAAKPFGGACRTISPDGGAGYTPPDRDPLPYPDEPSDDIAC